MNSASQDRSASPSITLAAAQSASVPGDVPRNVEHHLEFAHLAVEHGADLLIFPELSLTGYELDLARELARMPDSKEFAPLGRFAEASGMTIVAGAPLVASSAGDLHLGALIFRPDGAVLRYSKPHLHGGEDEGEARVFVPGVGGPVFEVGEAIVGLAICRDAKFPQHAQDAADRGANVYAVGALVDEADYPAKAAILAGHARRHNMAVVLSNYAGQSGGWISAGKSAIWSERGECVAASGDTEEALVIATRMLSGWEGDVLSMARVT